MCLQSNNTVLTAQEDLVCYKVYFKYTFQTTWRSPFKKYELPVLGTTIKIKTINEGVHVFSDLEGVIRFLSVFSPWILGMVSNSSKIYMKVIRCVIPTHSEFIEGTDKLTKAPAWCTNQLKFVDALAIVNEENYWNVIERLKSLQNEVSNS